MHPRSGCLRLFSGLLLGVMVASLAWLAGNRITPLSGGSLGAAYRAFQAGDLQQAISQAQQAYDAAPDDLEALTLLVRALIYRSYDDYNRGADLERALQLTNAAYNRLIGLPDVMSLHAYTLHANGRSGDALRLAERALDRDPENTLARITLALTYSRFGDHDRAILEHQPTLLGERWQMDAQRAVAISLGNAGRYDEAIAAVDRALAINDRLLMLHFERAFYALQNGDTDAATVAYFRVLAQDADNIKARLRMCELSTLLRETATALRYCQEVTSRAPTWAEGWYRLGREYFLQGAFEDAQQALNQCTTLLVRQNVPVEQRRFECWYLQGQSAEILGDCPGLMAVYSEFQAMTAIADIPQTWTYPPEGPAICLPD